MLSIEFHQQRRDRLIEQLLPNSVCVVPGNRLQSRSRDTEFTFRQNSDFYYLTGFAEPDAWLILSNSEQYGGSFSVLACLPKDPEKEVWQGRRVGPDAAIQAFGVDEACSQVEIEWVLADLLNQHDHLYFALGEHGEAETLVFEVLDQLRKAPKQSKKAPHTVQDIRTILHEMRLFKTPEELDVMRTAASISADAHCRAMRAAATARYEYQLEADILHEFAYRGARSAAYSSIVGSGKNACILHYTENRDPLHDDELVLIDAGAEYLGYAADITRTFPIGGRFTQPQATLYQLVLDSQYAALNILKPGATIGQAMLACLRVLVDGLIKLNMLEGDVEHLIAKKAYQRFFMHGLGHWIGLDVHDVGDYKRNGNDRLLEPNMVLTVEPGLYIPEDAPVPEMYRGIGIRIEDDIVITPDGHDILTNGVPKTIDAIERLMQQGS
ncbi:Xaa-Pro aminopeptidase [Alteromonas oceanisediminis]|uniref:Xaa-Pro aminopeptidase n=1 Tax=Alteromonas oceanisediminis TaxID=2836180 RepID=UPI001BD982CD|nr:Xaa-Pro aminopeptidase [Alteromonas oceanisediminis]MBT0585563.1 Xaa-Pro aminopeptidase [Alteromonas oceanisediminis]